MSLLLLIFVLIIEFIIKNFSEYYLGDNPHFDRSP